ncbi:hypothetical protein K1T71_014434 [Dendrolimus kikuchii]|uniref:Uncharacterized protein n=1 Tax=Dendrolimus kikuchii TaxID=765133 RepID=A0ACC1CE89_9NEOP|nr:hypothetical protein K1T71_014434 [Dendrolimus kikuchii]
MPPTRKRSPLWNHFSQLADNKAKCGYCAQILSIPNKSIGNMSRHMRLKHPSIQIHLSRQATQIQKPQSPTAEHPDPIASSSSSQVLAAATPISLPVRNVTQAHFISLTVHYLDSNNKIVSYLLDCFSFFEKHTAVNLVNSLKAKMTEWKIQHKVVAVEVTAANISAAIKMGSWRHIGCFAHSVNLVVQVGLKEIKNPYTKVKAIVEYFKRSSPALAKLREIQIQMGLS